MYNALNETYLRAKVQTTNMCIVSRCRLLNGNCRMFDLAIVTFLVISDLLQSFRNILLFIHVKHSYLLRVLFSKFEFPALISGFPIN